MNGALMSKDKDEVNGNDSVAHDHVNDNSDVVDSILKRIYDNKSVSEENTVAIDERIPASIIIITDTDHPNSDVLNQSVVVIVKVNIFIYIFMSFVFVFVVWENVYCLRKHKKKLFPLYNNSFPAEWLTYIMFIRNLKMNV